MGDQPPSQTPFLWSAPGIRDRRSVAQGGVGRAGETGKSGGNSDPFCQRSLELLGFCTVHSCLKAACQYQSLHQSHGPALSREGPSSNLPRPRCQHHPLNREELAPPAPFPTPPSISLTFHRPGCEWIAWKHCLTLCARHRHGTPSTSKSWVRTRSISF